LVTSIKISSAAALLQLPETIKKKLEPFDIDTVSRCQRDFPFAPPFAYFGSGLGPFLYYGVFSICFAFCTKLKSSWTHRSARLRRTSTEQIKPSTSVENNVEISGFVTLQALQNSREYQQR